MDTSLDDKLVKKYRRNVKYNWVAVVTFLAIHSLAILLGIVGIACAETGTGRVIFCFILIGIPALAIFGFIKFERASKELKEKFEQMIKGSSMTADDVMKLGEELEISLFGLAVDIRCIKELGLPGVPEWCARDGVLPTAEQVR